MTKKMPLVIAGLALCAVGSHNGSCTNTRIPNDPLFSFQWGHHNTGQEVFDFDQAIGFFFGHPVQTGVADADTDAPRAWHFRTDCPGVIFAVLDTGVDHTHPDLVDNMWVNAAEANGTPGVDDDGNGYVDDLHGWNFYDESVPDGTFEIPAGTGIVPGGDGAPDDTLGTNAHGTLVAGVYGARGDNGEGLAGVCWTGEIMALKAFPEEFNNQPPFFTNPVDAVVEAIDYAIAVANAEGKRLILNMSWGITLFDLESQGPPAAPQSLLDAFERIHDNGHLVVTGIGNGDTHEFVETTGQDINTVLNTHETEPGCWVDCTSGPYCDPDPCEDPENRPPECVRCSPDEPLVVSFYPQQLTGEHVFDALAVNPVGDLAAWSWWGVPQGITGTPGEYVWTTLPTYPTEITPLLYYDDPDDDPDLGPVPYHGANGTSLSAPYLGGALALALAEHPQIAQDLASADPATRSQGYQALRDLVVQAVDPIPSMDGLSVSGGRLNLHRIVRPLP